MKITLRNRLGGELQTWENEFAFADNVRRGRAVLSDGDTIEVADTSWKDFDSVSSPHHY